MLGIGVRKKLIQSFIMRLDLKVLSVFALALVVCAALCFSSCQPPQMRKPQPDLIILQTGRLRGNVYPPGATNFAPLQHYAKVAGYIKSVRAEAEAIGAKVFVVDLGDSFAGSFASEATHGRNMVTFFNSVGYDAVCLGNLDAMVKPSWLEGLKAAVLTPFVDADGQPVPAQARPVHSFTLEGVGTLRLLANFYGDTDPSSAPHRFPAWFMGTDRGVRPVRDYKALLSQSEVPALTVFSWMKFEAPHQPPQNFYEKLRMLGVDFVLAHRVYSGAMKDIWLEDSFLPWSPPVAQNILRENRGFTVGRLDIKREGETWQVVSHRLVPMNEPSIKPDESVQEALKPLAEMIQAANKPLARLGREAGKKEILNGVLKAFATVEGVEAVAYSLESVRAALPAGEIQTSQLFESLPWTGSIQRLDLTHEEIRRLTEIKTLVVYLKSNRGDEGGMIPLVTSRYFAALISERLAIPPERISVVADSESEFLKSLDLRARAEEFFFGKMNGWELLK